MSCHAYDTDGEMQRLTWGCICPESSQKWLTSAECAAEYWCSEWRCASPETTYEIKVESARRVAILYRFATLPHAGDRNYE